MSTRRMSAESERAHYILRRAIHYGCVDRPAACDKCGCVPGAARDGRAKIQAHHYRGYDYPMSVMWLCPKCHWAETDHPKLHTPKIRRNARGAFWDGGRRKWRARIVVEGKALNLGQFSTEQEAHAAYAAKRAEISGARNADADQSPRP